MILALRSTLQREWVLVAEKESEQNAMTKGEKKEEKKSYGEKMGISFKQSSKAGRMPFSISDEGTSPFHRTAHAQRHISTSVGHAIE